MLFLCGDVWGNATVSLRWEFAIGADKTSPVYECKRWVLIIT
ncbi:MAG: hypothetical protein R2847_05110 [Bacteroidia bacterium]